MINLRFFKEWVKSVCGANEAKSKNTLSKQSSAQFVGLKGEKEVCVSSWWNEAKQLNRLKIMAQNSDSFIHVQDTKVADLLGLSSMYKVKCGL